MPPSDRAATAQPVRLLSTAPRDPLALLYALLLLALSYDVFARTDTPAALLSVLLLVFVLYRRAWNYVPAAALLVFLFPAARFYPHWVWRVPAAWCFVPLALTVLVCAPFARLRARFEWLRVGKHEQITWFLVALTALVSALALVLWALWTDYLGVATQMLASFKTAPRWFSILIMVPGFALVNAAAEELVYRGVLFDALEEGWGGAPWALLTLQASAFAAAHYAAGFPNGRLGYLMVFVYALMLGYLRRRTGGIVAPYVAHVCADAVIGATLVLLVS
jgi:membrane protease YdiL (CAAX protease family)